MNTSVIQIEESNLKMPENLSEPKKRILVVESNKDGVNRLATQLGAAGYEAITHEPANAPTAAKRNPPDLVIVDISILGDAGFGLAERIQQSVRWCVPTIFVTTRKEPQLRKKAEIFQAVGFFEEGYDVKDLVAAVDLAFCEEDSDETVETLSE